MAGAMPAVTRDTAPLVQAEVMAVADWLYRSLFGISGGGGAGIAPLDEPNLLTAER